ncbi:MAG: Hsp20 family protein [Terriglobia bacterium]
MSTPASKRQRQEEMTTHHHEGQAQQPALLMGADLASLFSAVQESISHRAYELFDARGCEGGQELADWLQAEGEILHPLSEEITESHDKVKIRAAVSGFSPEHLKIGIEPRRLIISGKREETVGEGGRNRETSSLRFFSRVDLPVDVDPEKSTASLQGNELTISLPKVSTE